MVKTILFGLLFFTTSIAYSQSSPIPEAEAARQNVKDLSNDNNITGLIKSFNRPYEGIKGTPYYGKTWNKAKLTINNKVFDIIAVKYNVYENYILFKNNEGKELMLDVDKIAYFEMADSITKETLVFEKLSSLGQFEPAMLNRFAIVLHKGKNVSLINIPEKDLIKANYTGAYSPGRTYDEFVDDQSYYFIKNNIPAKVKLNKKSLLKIVSDKAGKIEAFLKAERLDANTETGWVKALAYYDSI